MQLQEQIARELRRSTVLLTTSSPRQGGNYGGGVGTVVGDKYIVTTKHCITTKSPIHIWHPEDEFKQDFRIVRSYTKGENSLIEVNKKLPFPAYPITRKPVPEVMNPGATIVYPAGYEFYTMTEDYQMPMNVGIYSGPAKENTYLAWGRISYGTSGAAIVSLEDEVIVGILYGMIKTRPEGSQDSIIFWGVDNLAGNLDLAGIPSPESTGPLQTIEEQILPDTQNKYLQWGIMALAGVGGTVIARSLLE